MLERILPKRDEVYERPTRATAAGRPRGLPAVGRSVQGAIRGRARTTRTSTSGLRRVACTGDFFGRHRVGTTRATPTPTAGVTRVTMRIPLTRAV